MFEKLKFLIVDHFFAPRDSFEPCGMFTSNHILSAILCIVSVFIVFWIFQIKNVKINKTKVIRSLAFIITILECIKIAHSFYYGYLYLDSWFPLSYCGLFIYALWIVGYGKSSIKRAGEIFIAYGCPVAGVLFLIFPTTSLMSFPIWHYLSLYSLLFHTLMIFCGMILLCSEPKLNKFTYLHYIVFITVFSIVAITLNCIYGCNLMNLREPYNIPIGFLQNLYANSKIGFTLFAYFIFAIIPFVSNLLFLKKRKTFCISTTLN